MRFGSISPLHSEWDPRGRMRSYGRVEYFIGLYCNLLYVSYKIMMHTMICGNRPMCGTRETTWHTWYTWLSHANSWYRDHVGSECNYDFAFIILFDWFSFLYFLIYLIIFIKNYHGVYLSISMMVDICIYMLYIFFIASFINFENCWRLMCL